MKIKKISFALLFLSTLLSLANQASAQKAPAAETTTLAKIAASKNVAKEKKSDEEATRNETVPSKQVVIASFADTVEDLLPTVVNISATQEAQSSNTIDQSLINELPKTPIFEDFRNQLEKQFRGSEQKKKISSIGSGFLTSKDGFIVTNSHVVEETDEITVSLYEGAKYKAKVVGVDKKTDLALLKINPEKELKFARFGDSNKARIGDWVIVVGNPYGLGSSVSVGIVSARGRDINNGQSDDFIQTDAAINKGNSGGPIFNARGEVIGISTAIFSPSGGNVGIGFATPSATVAQVVKQLREQGEVVRGWLGISVQDVTDEIAESMKMEKTKGAFVVDVVNDGPAARAGIVPTDIITKIDDIEITEMKILPRTISQYPIGKTAKITLLRQGKLKTIKAKVEKMRNDDNKKTEVKLFEKKQVIKPTVQVLDLGLAELTSKIKKDKNELSIEGLLVVEVNPKSEAASKNIMVGDIILSANQVPIKTISELKKIIEETSKSNKKLFFFVKRGENNYAVVLTVK